MEHLKQQPANYPNVYWYDRRNNQYPTITFIFWGITPTGRRSKYYHQIRITAIGNKKDWTLQQCADEARRIMELPKLPKKYIWSEMFIQHNFLRK